MADIPARFIARRFARHLWYKTAVPVFIERFLLASMAAAFIAVVFVNPLKFDNIQRTTAALVLFFGAAFLAQTLYRHNESSQAPAPTPEAKTEAPQVKPSDQPLAITTTAPTPQTTQQATSSKTEEPPKVTVRTEPPVVVEKPAPTPPPTPEPPKTRTLTEEQKQAMVTLLRPHSGRNIMLIKTGDAEARLFAQQIQEVFAAAGWNVHVGEIDKSSAPMYGVVCYVLDPQRIPPHADAVISAFQKAGIRVSLAKLFDAPIPFTERAQHERQGTISLRVGKMP